MAATPLTAEDTSTERKPKKQIQLNFFETACVSSVNAIGQWKFVSS
jgi:hypothetical protein